MLAKTGTPATRWQQEAWRVYGRQAMEAGDGIQSSLQLLINQRTTIEAGLHASPHLSTDQLHPVV